MSKLTDRRSIYLRAVRAYLLAIVSLIILFVAFNLFSWWRQRQVQAQLSDTLLVANGQSLAVEFERRIWELVEDCLRDPEVRQIHASIWAGPSGASEELTSRTKYVSSRYPIAREIYSIRGQNIRVLKVKTGVLAGAGNPGTKATVNVLIPEQSKNLEIIQWMLDLDRAGRKPILERVNSRAFQVGDDDESQAFLILLHAEEGLKKEALGIVVDLPWLREELLPLCKRELEKKQILAWMFEISDSREQKESTLGSPRVPFRTILPFWELGHASSVSDSLRRAVHEDILYRGIGMAMLLAVLGLATYLLVRITPELNAIQVRNYLMSGLSHELKTPLSLIRLYAETLERDQTLPDPDRAKCYQVILRESERLSNLVENLLDFTRLEREHERYRMAEGDLLPVITATLDICERWVSHLGFRIHRDLSTGLPAVRFDAEKITQAVLNLVDNARKYSGKSRDIWVRLRSEEGQVFLEIRDQGTGIPAEDREKVLQPFYRGRQQEHQPGCGLGLYMVRRIMIAHGGSIEIAGEMGAGTTIRLNFPAYRPLPQEGSRLEPQPDSSAARS